MPLEDFRLIRLSDDHYIKPFNCDDDDLNGFLFEDAKAYLRELLAVTYILQSDTNTIAFLSLLNDKISVTDFPSNRKWQRLIRDVMPLGKRLRSYPAMKIGRFAVDVEHSRNGIGTELLGYIKEYMVENNKTGCKFITVDAYQQSLNFYKKNGFIYMTDEDKNDETRSMYFDLSTL